MENKGIIKLFLKNKLLKSDEVYIFYDIITNNYEEISGLRPNELYEFFAKKKSIKRCC